MQDVDGIEKDLCPLNVEIMGSETRNLHTPFTLLCQFKLTLNNHSKEKKPKKQKIILTPGKNDLMGCLGVNIIRALHYSQFL